MPKKTVDIDEAQSHLKELVSAAGSGTEVILTQDQKPVAQLLALEPKVGPRTAGLHKGAICASDDFDEPLPGGFWTGGH